MKPRAPRTEGAFQHGAIRHEMFIFFSRLSGHCYLFIPLVLSPIAELADREVEASIRVSLLTNTDFWLWVANVVFLLEMPTIAFKGRWLCSVFLVEFKPVKDACRLNFLGTITSFSS